MYEFFLESIFIIFYFLSIFQFILFYFNKFCNFVDRSDFLAFFEGKKNRAVEF